ncbi:MAG TPA: hypothetical protein VI072_10700 [Polyangiaceae bacterium]
MTRARTTAVFAGMLGACCALLLACSAGRPTPLVQRRSLLESITQQSGFRTPAVWRYHPTEAAALYAEADLGSQLLFAGARGERWLVDKRTRQSRAAASLAPEDLIAILRRGPAWLFVGKSGTSYEAAEPLAEFSRASAPFEPFVKVTANSGVMLGVRRDGRLLRSNDAGSSWQRVGPPSVEFVDVVVGRGQGALALSIPEALWQSKNEGSAWERAKVQSFAAFELGTDVKDRLLARGVLETRGFEPLAGTSFAAEPGALRSGQLSLGKPPARGPDAGALREGRAAISAGSYWELTRTKGSADWRLVSGPFDGALRARQLPQLRGCEVARLAAFGRWLYLACSRRTAGSSAQPLELWRSEDAGRTFQREPFGVQARLAQFSLAVGEGGALLLGGICPAHDAQSGCKTYGLHHRRFPARPGAKSRGRAGLAVSAAPGLNDAPMAVAFSADGRRAYALGRRTKNNALFLFVSRDGARSFAPRELAETGGEPPADDSELEQYTGRFEASSQDLESFGVGDDGTLSVVVRVEGSLQLLITDPDGRLLSVGTAPPEVTLLGAAGARALALSLQSRRVWESLDGGSTWQSAGQLPLDPCVGDDQCRLPVWCHAGGCTIGDELSRLGWRAAAHVERLDATGSSRSAARAVERQWRTPISCSLDEERWRALPGASLAPTADQAALGKVAWFASASDAGRAAASVFHGFGGARPRVETLTLLPPAARAERYAFVLSRQVEGTAALRYLVPDARAGQTELRDLEIAWSNLFEGRVGHARLAQAGSYQPGDYERPGNSGAQLAEPALFSIASGGVYLRLHRLRAERQPTLFLDGRSVTTLPPVDWPSVPGENLRSEMVRVGAEHVPLLLARDGKALVRARRDGSRWLFDAYAASFFDAAQFGLETYSDIAYVGGRAGLHLASFDELGTRRQSNIFVFRASGAVTEEPVPVPIQHDTADPPRACSPVQRADTPRVVVPFQPGTRHPIVVNDAAEPLRVLLTNAAVLHGTPSAPCVAAYDAEPVPAEAGSTTARERAVLLLDDLEHAWLFRTSADSERASGALEYRTMSCRFDATLEVPQEVQRARGVRVAP